MSQLRIVRPASNFAQVSNTVLADPTLSWKAKGLYSYLMSLPPDWHVRRSHLIEQSTEGRHAFESGLMELRDGGLLTIEQLQDEQGQFSGTIWRVRVPGFPSLGSPASGSPALRSTCTLSNTKDSNTDSTNTDSDTEVSAEVPSQDSHEQEDPKEEAGTERMLIEWWIREQPQRPPGAVIAKQRRAAQRVCSNGKHDDVARAAFGMRNLFPYCDGAPWDLFDLERLFAKALAAGHGKVRKRGQQLSDLSFLDEHEEVRHAAGS